MVGPRAALEADAPLIRDEKGGQSDNRCYRWETGDAAATERALAEADLVVSLDTHYPRSHSAPLGDLRMRRGREPGHRQGHDLHDLAGAACHRTLFAIVAGLPEQNIQIISPDIGGGFGNKVPIYRATSALPSRAF